MQVQATPLTHKRFIIIFIFRCGRQCQRLITTIIATTTTTAGGNTSAESNAQFKFILLWSTLLFVVFYYFAFAICCCSTRTYVLQFLTNADCCWFYSFIIAAVVALITCWLAVGASVVESRTLWQAFDSKTSIAFCSQPRFANTLMIFIEEKNVLKLKSL